MTLQQELDARIGQYQDGAITHIECILTIVQLYTRFSKQIENENAREREGCND